MTQSMQQQQPAWEVVRVEDAFGPASLGASNRMKRVTFRMNVDQSESYVDVPYGPGWVEKANAEIEQMVMDHVRALSLHSDVAL